MAATSYSKHTLLSMLKHHTVSRCLQRQSFCRPISTRPLKPCPLYHVNKKLCHQSMRYTSSSQTKTIFLHVLEQKYGDKIAIVDNLGQHSYNSIIEHSTELSPYIIANATCDSAVSDKPSTETESPQLTLNGERIAFLCPNNASYVIAQWAIWMAGGVAVPLCKDHPSAELEYVVENSQSSLLLSTPLYEQMMQGIADKFDIKHIVLNESALCQSEQPSHDNKDSSNHDSRLPAILQLNSTDSLNLEVVEKQVLRDKWHEISWKHRNAMLIYTSGTTGRPKGVVTRFGAYQTQVSMMLKAWEWTSKDVVLHILPLHHIHGVVPLLGCAVWAGATCVMMNKFDAEKVSMMLKAWEWTGKDVVLHTLPLHHVHGVINLLGCPLWTGATCVMMNKFDAEKVWQMLMSNTEPRINVFMAVPTIYAKLIEFYNTTYHKSSMQVKGFIEASLKERVRLMVSGSSALPQPIMEEWETITGHRILERYGMTEIGMALSNPLNGQRIAGAVGTPMPYVQVRIVDLNGDVLVEGNSHGSKVKKESDSIEGDLQVNGPAVFKEYWNRPDATAETFSADGWFKTGDTARYKDGIYYLKGRTSVDIIKSGGYKISALDVERHLLSHPHIAECAVVGVPDLTWGQQVGAIVVLKPGKELTLAELRDWSRDHMASYVIPTQLKLVYEIPRNAMGKVNKKQLLGQMFGNDQTPRNPTNDRLNSVVGSMRTESE